MVSEATLKLVVGQEQHTVAEAIGERLDNAPKGSNLFIPAKVHVSRGSKCALSMVRPGQSQSARAIESRDKKDEWGTVGVSENIIEPSWQAWDL